MSTDYGQVYPLWPDSSESVDKFQLDHGLNITDDQIRHEMALLAVQSHDPSPFSIQNSDGLEYGPQNGLNPYQGHNLSSNFNLAQVSQAQYSSHAGYGNCGTLHLENFSQQNNREIAESNANSLSAMSRNYSSSSNTESLISSSLNPTAFGSNSTPQPSTGQDSQTAALALTGLSTMSQRETFAGSRSSCKDPCRGPCPSEDVMMCETEHGQPLEDCDEGNCAGTYCDDCEETDCPFPASCLSCEWDECDYFVSDNPTLFQHLVSDHIAMQNWNNMISEEFQRSYSSQNVMNPLPCPLPGCDDVPADTDMLQSHVMNAHSMTLPQCRWRDCHQTLLGPTALQSHVSEHLGVGTQEDRGFTTLSGFSPQTQDLSHTVSELEASSSSNDMGDSSSTYSTLGAEYSSNAKGMMDGDPFPIVTSTSDKSQLAQIEETGKCKWILDDGEICSKTFEDGKQLQEHIESSHLSIGKGHRNNNKEFVCLWHGCHRRKKPDQQPWTKSQQIKEHLRTHTKCMLLHSP